MPLRPRCLTYALIIYTQLFYLANLRLAFASWQSSPMEFPIKVWVESVLVLKSHPFDPKCVLMVLVGVLL